mmetsp:Transcript_17494/g.22165  ORF Transcript_17494/g.22165 Transcript_17494/m.22165 type:complete len:312 (-) Transcript_17494:179-1114(-)
MLGKALGRLLDHVLGDDLVRLQEVVEGHGAVLLVLGLTKDFALSDEQLDDLRGGLGAIELSLLLRLLLSDDEAAERLQLLVILKVEVLAGVGQVLQVEAELLLEGIGGLAHLDGLNLGSGLGARGELEGLQLAEHLHVALELELGSLDDVVLSLGDLLGLEGHAHLAVFLLELSALLGVFHVLLDGELVVLGIELNPLAGLLSHADDGVLELLLTLAEGSDVLLLVLLTEGLELAHVERFLLGEEGAHGLASDDSAKDHVVVVLEGAVKVGLEISVLVHGLAHGELGVLVLVFGLGASEQVAEHFTRCVGG